MKPAVPQYLEHTAFGARAKQKYPGVFAGNEAAAASIARMLPQQLVSRSDNGEGGTGRLLGAEAEAGNFARSLIANAPFACGARVVYFEVDCETASGPGPGEDAAAADGEVGSEFAVNIGIEKRYIGRGPLRTEFRGGGGSMASPESSDERSDFEEGPSLESSVWSECEDEEVLQAIGENRLFHYSEQVVLSTLDKKGVWDWVWKLGSGMASFTRGALNYHELHMCEPMGALPRRPVRVGFMLDLVANKAVLTKEGRMVAAHQLETKRMMSVPSELAELFVLVPTLTIRNARVRSVFGDGNLPNDGFKFDVAAYMQAQAQAQAGLPLPPPPAPAAVHAGTEQLMKMVLDYFMFYGYEKTVRAWLAQRPLDEHDVAAAQAVRDGWSRNSGLALRKEIRQQITAGNIARVYELLLQAGVKEPSTDLRFKLDCYAFAQLVRRSAPADIDEVLARGRVLFREYKADSDAAVKAKLERVSGLLVADDPSGEAYEALYGREAVRELTAATLSAVAEAEGSPASPALLNLLADTQLRLNVLARHGNGTASMLASQLAEQIE